MYETQSKPSIRNFFSLFLQSGDHVVETGALLHEVVDLLADGAVGGQRRVEVDHDAVEAVLEQADAVRHVVLVPGRRRRRGRRRRTASCLKLFFISIFHLRSWIDCFTFTADESAEEGGCS